MQGTIMSCMIGIEMDRDNLISKLDDEYKKDEQYKCLDYIMDHTAAFISAIAVIPTIFALVVRLISFLVLNVKCHYWNIGEGFLVEDNGIYSKIAGGVLVCLATLLINNSAKSYVKRWALFDCKLDLVDRIASISNNKINNEINSQRGRITDYNSLPNEAYVPLHEAEVNEMEHTLDDIEEKHKTYFFKVKKEINKKKALLIGRLVLWFLVVFIAFLLLFLVSGVDYSTVGIIGFIISILSISILTTVLAIIIAFREVKLKIKDLIMCSLDEDNDIINYGIGVSLIDWLDKKIIEQKTHSIKSLFSDNSLKNLAASLIFVTIFWTIYLVLSEKYSLANNDSFYILYENNQNYAMLINDENKYVFSECDIVDDKIIINTDNIMIRNNPISLEKMHFESVEKIQDK